MTSASPRLSDNPLLEFLTRTRWWVAPVVYGPMIALIVVGSIGWGGLPWWAAPPLLLGGVLAWTLYEYLLHRFLFHWTPPIPGGERIQKLWHGIHHEFYDDPVRIVINPLITLWLAGLMAVPHIAIAWLLADVLPVGAALTWFAGTLAGWITYAVTHWALHCHPFKSARMRRLRAHHMLHHLDPRYAHARYGVTTPLWDRVFGTMAPRSAPSADG